MSEIARDIFSWFVICVRPCYLVLVLGLNDSVCSIVEFWLLLQSSKHCKLIVFCFAPISVHSHFEILFVLFF